MKSIKEVFNLFNKAYKKKVGKKYWYPHKNNMIIV